MRAHSHKEGDVVTFQAHVGSGDYNGAAFELGVTCAPDGTLLGMPVFTFPDDGVTVAFELKDLLPLALKEVKEKSRPSRCNEGSRHD